MDTVIAAIVGVVVGAALTLLVLAARRRPAADLARKLVEETEARREQDTQALLDRVRATFADLSRHALSSNSEEFLRLADTRFSAQAKQGETALEGKKRLIDETVKQIAAKLGDMDRTLRTLEQDRRQSHGALVQKLEHTAQVTAALQSTTAQLRAALANPQRRGQWGERMAEDVLRLAGFIEGVNYEKQSVLETGGRPDFTFLLPAGRRVNMDVKFPLANYLHYLDADDEAAGERARNAFLRDVRQRIREVTTRAYIDPDQGTLDYVLVFIPNEQIYGFIHQHDPNLLDDALRQKVVLCSPLTLYAVLAVIRQAAENFRLEQASREILSLLGAFQKEWARYTDLMDKMGRSLEQTMRHYETLATTRTRRLERQLDKIEDLRSQEHIALPAETGADE